MVETAGAIQRSAGDGLPALMRQTKQWRETMITLLFILMVIGIVVTQSTGAWPVMVIIILASFVLFGFIAVVRSALGLRPKAIPPPPVPRQPPLLHTLVKRAVEQQLEKRKAAKAATQKRQQLK